MYVSIQCYVRHRYLHSFPTRRSSDLVECSVGEGKVRQGVPFTQPRPEDLGDDDDGPHGDERSEEHTSELQSHSDLVCRLLLEKKKYIQQIAIGTSFSPQISHRTTSET